MRKELEPAKCDSCGQITELFDVKHHQPGNETVWHYCQVCKDAHDQNVKDLVEANAIRTS